MSAVRVLVLDDDPLQIELLERALSRDGFEVMGVERAALLDAAAREFRPDVVLLDVNLHGESTEGTVTRARAAAPTGARVLLYSSWEDSRLRALARELGADGWISKGESVVGIGHKLKRIRER